MAKLRLGSYIFENAKLKYGSSFFYSKCWNKALLGCYIVENANIRYRGFYFVGNAKIRYSYNFIDSDKIRYSSEFVPLKMPK